MSRADAPDLIHTRIWLEEAEADNPFAVRAAYCRGFDVFGQMVGQARWVDMLVLLFRDELPAPSALDLLEALAVALANAGPRDPAIHAAMCGGAGGSTAASSLIAALAVGAGRYGGAREVFDAMGLWADCGTDLAAWRARLAAPPPKETGVWPDQEHPPGFDPHGVSTPTVVRQLLDRLTTIGGTPRLAWLSAHRPELEQAAGRPLAISGVAAAALADLGFAADEGEMLFLLLRLPGAAAHALEQRRLGHKKFPFFKAVLESGSVESEPVGSELAASEPVGSQPVASALP